MSVIDFSLKGKVAIVLSNIGLLLLRQSKFRAALSVQLQALQMSRDIKYKTLEASILGNVGLLYSSLGEYGKAMEMQKKVFSGLKDDPANKK